MEILDKTGNVIKNIITVGKGKEKTVSTTTFDKKGQKVGKTVVKGSGDSQVTTRYTF